MFIAWQQTIFLWIMIKILVIKPLYQTHHISCSLRHFVQFLIVLELCKSSDGSIWKQDLTARAWVQFWPDTFSDANSGSYRQQADGRNCSQFYQVRAVAKPQLLVLSSARNWELSKNSHFNQHSGSGLVKTS